MDFLVPTSCLCVTLRERREMHVIREIQESGKTGWRVGNKFYYSKFKNKLKGILKGNYFIFSLQEFDSSLWSQCHY